MSDIAERYRRLAGTFEERIAAVPADRWEDPSPCEDWTARDVVRHVVDTQALFLGFVGREAGELPGVDDDPLGAFAGARRVVQADLDDAEQAQVGFEGFFGPTTFEAAVDRFLCGDLVVHGWDLARATGLDEHIDAGDVEAVTAEARRFGDAFRSPGVCGPEVEVPADASAKDKLLAFYGRRP
jgi:uncharacterized protein (TIGR03086 family)